MNADQTREEMGFSFVFICGHLRKSAAKSVVFQAAAESMLLRPWSHCSPLDASWPAAIILNIPRLDEGSVALL
jgi:hypothetical protein